MGLVFQVHVLCLCIHKTCTDQADHTKPCWYGADSLYTWASLIDSFMGRKWWWVCVWMAGLCQGKSLTTCDVHFLNSHFISCSVLSFDGSSCHTLTATDGQKQEISVQGHLARRGSHGCRSKVIAPSHIEPSVKSLVFSRLIAPSHIEPSVKSLVFSRLITTLICVKPTKCSGDIGQASFKWQYCTVTWRRQ